MSRSMLQRAASNAYSWWWASHIRTTQSKWLDANLQDVEDRVKTVLKLLGQEADSFGKRAEMYYHTRPEVISHVEQLYRAYRALVERYDHISKELHKANHTIATACPEEVQYAMLEEEDHDHDFPKAITPIKRHGSPSGWNKLLPPPSEAREEIGRLQKAILVLQTEKEYVKSSYESGIARYREIEKQIADTHKEICAIQDNFDAHAAIGDDEARALMAITALRSCQGTISELVRHFEELIRLSAAELEKTKSLRAQLYAMDGNTGTSSREASSTGTSRPCPVTQMMIPELQRIYEKLDKFFASASESSAEEIAENVDELVDKVINLELKIPKQTAQINQLIQENDNLKTKLDDLQDEMALRDDQSDLDEQIKQLEDEFSTVQVLERSIIEEEASVSIGFSQVFSCIINISKALGSVGPEDLHNSSTAVEDGAIVSKDVVLEHTTEESKGGDFRDINAPPTLSPSLVQDKEDISEVVNDNGNYGIHGPRNANEENISGSCLMHQVRYKLSLHSEDHINPFVSSENENRVHDSGEGNVDSSSEVFQSSSENENGSRNFPKGEVMRGEYPLGIVSQTHLLHSGSMDTLDKKYGSNEASQLLMEVTEGNISDGSSFTSTSVIQEEGLGDSKSQNTSGQISAIASSDLYSLKEKDSLEESSLREATCFSGADNSLHLGHGNEAQSVEELPDQGGQINGSQNIESLNECSKVGLLKEDNCISLGHVDHIQDMKNRYSSEVRETSICLPAGDSEQLLRNLEKSSHGKELAREETASNNYGGGSLGKKSGLMGEEFVPSWQEFLLDGLEGREAILLADYTSVLRNYKETKRRLTELEKKNQEHLEETKAVIRELRNANSMKYVEIRSLRDLLDSSEMPPSKAVSNSNGFLSVRSFREVDSRSNGTLGTDISTVEESSSSNIEAATNTSLFEVRFRNDIDTLVEENLQFLVRYSMACHHMEEFDRRYQEVQNELENMKDDKTGEPGNRAQPEPAEKKLRELRTELDVWFEQNALLDQELQLKSASLCRLQEEIAEALRGSLEMDRTKLFTPYEAAKFQGEVLNMQQSTSKVENELQAASERMRGLQAKINHALEKLRESSEFSSQPLSQPETESSYEKQFKHFPSRTRVPLRNFLFGTKRKKKSMFACINPTLQKQFSDL